MLNLRVSDALIKQIKACVKQNGVCHVLGCGNFYTRKEDAITKKDFTNPDQEEATYMITFDRVEDVPNTPKELEDAFYNAKRKEQQLYGSIREQKQRNVLIMDDEEAKTEVDVKRSRKNSGA